MTYLRYINNLLIYIKALSKQCLNIAIIATIFKETIPFPENKKIRLFNIERAF